MKRFVLSFFVMFVMLLVFGFLVHGLLLTPEYGQLPNMMRNPADGQAHMAFLIIGQVFFAVAFVWIYQRGKEDKPFVAQGFRYGLAMAALTVVAKFMIYYAVQQEPGMLAVKQIVFDSIGIVLMGVVLAALNK
jgi:uncharacterized BrkB/YihY/UPF0761 family membrane protein